ncbi:LytTR family transcriptional regulator DNA-binding domain-containing protein [Paenibacillus sp. IB182496]|uniref:LytTR family transcriptional regulator DNA-binding domain-containing protein n=1 Tax=Paenibacillus sabuli TaxID=2772509 RepID=A0A927BTA6_9BACL|nr:LytTR family DNA-binding domain-containing protein [Paenibacillus sabuli]MBD2845033.1 LytTR family transcriptional regulator DNA-binding domain-containing protein [Paenibacillus sabuli]
MRVLDLEGNPWDISEPDIYYFTSHRSTIYIHAKQGVFLFPATLSDLLVAYQPLGFERLDRSNVVNLGNVDRYDADRKLVFFPGQDTFSTVSEANERRLKRYLRMHPPPP